LSTESTESTDRTPQQALPSASILADRLDRVDSLLRPRTVAVIGASSQRRTLGNVVVGNFDRWAFDGTLLVVHPTAERIGDRPTVASIQDLPRRLDVAVVCLPARAVADTLLQLDDIGCRAAVVVAAGFQPDDENRFRDVLRRVSVAVCGPNNMGTINVTDSIALYTARFRDPLPAGSAALIAQSGSAAIAILNNPGVGFSKVITSGNEWSLTSADYVRWLADDPATNAVGLVLESIQNPPAFALAARELARAGKRLVVVKVGRSPAGSAAAQAHSGALLSTADAYEAYFRRECIPVARDYDELVATLQGFSQSAMPKPAGNRLGVIAISGGEGALACDVATEMGMPLAQFSDATRSVLEAVLPGARPENPIDFGASVGRAEAAQERAIRAVLSDPNVDLALVLQDAQHSLPIHDAHDYVQYLDILHKATEGAEKPIVVASTTSTDTHPRLEQTLQGRPIPLVRGIREAVAVCRNIAQAGAARARAEQLTASPEEVPARPEVDCGLFRQDRGPLPDAACQTLLRAYGLPMVQRLFVRDAEEARDAVEKLGYPLVVKVVSRSIAHRSDVGGVVVGVRDEEGLKRALRDIAGRVTRSFPESPIEGFELQPQILDVTEAIVGFKAEAGFGGTVTVGMGGVLVELYGKPAIELVPVTVEEAEDMIRRTPLGRILAGYRGLIPRTPIRGLAEVVVSLSHLGRDQTGLVHEVDLNPVLIRHGSGDAVIVDALVIAGGPSGEE
jgi:acyl-CoA synthetase (NDP forming)